jgi:hypothetical protein
MNYSNEILKMAQDFSIVAIWTGAWQQAEGGTGGGTSTATLHNYSDKWCEEISLNFNRIDYSNLPSLIKFSILQNDGSRRSLNCVPVMVSVTSIGFMHPALLNG